MNLTIDHFEESEEHIIVIMGEIEGEELYHHVTDDIFKEKRLYIVDRNDRVLQLHLLDMRLTRLPDGDYEIRFWVEQLFDPQMIQIDSPIYAPYEIEEEGEESHDGEQLLRLVR